MDQRSLPLGYAWGGQEPDPQETCDLTECQHQADQDDTKSTLTCGHSFHVLCMPARDSRNCPICLPRLLVKVQVLSNTFNAGLLKEEEEDVQSDDEEEDDNGDDDGDPNPPRENGYYMTQEFRVSLDRRFRQKISEE